MRRALRAAALALLAASAAASEDAPATAAAFSLPAPGACVPEAGSSAARGEDAPPFPFAPGDALDADALPRLRSFLPVEIWELRERFFYEGMRLEIGACFADYGPPGFFREATQRFAGSARLAPDGGLTEYTAGLPFPPETIAKGDPRAGLRWAWNVAHRYRGAGFRGTFRLADMWGPAETAQIYAGELFLLQLAHRADRPGNDYRETGGEGKQWVAGGEMTEPFGSREHAWRQIRLLENEWVRDRSDDLHAYLPEARRVRRLALGYGEGLYLPSQAIGVERAPGLAILQMSGSVAVSIGTVSPKRSGFEAQEIRPLLWTWRVLGARDVITPIAARSPLYPAARDREFGPWGVSFASDRWDLRRALVLESRAVREGAEGQVNRRVLYVDLQTLVPLYAATWDERDRPLHVGLYVGRWSEDRDVPPRWPDDPERPVRTIDPVGAAFVDRDEGGGWRRESWDMVSTPPPSQRVARMISVSQLGRGH